MMIYVLLGIAFLGAWAWPAWTTHEQNVVYKRWGQPTTSQAKVFFSVVVILALEGLGFWFLFLR